MKKSLSLLPDIAGIYSFVLFVSLIVLGGEHALRAGDTFWHIKAGATMLERQSLLTQDIFSHTAYGKPWIAHEWLAEVVMAALHHIAGLPGVVLVFLLIAVLSYWLLFRLVNQFVGEGLAICCVTVAVLLSLPHLLIRPHIFSWLFGVATLYILTVRRDRLYLLPLLSAVWVNLHGGFLLGIVLQVLFIAGFILDNRLQSSTNFKLWLEDSIRQSKQPILILIFSILAAGLNPFGYELFLFPFQVTKEIFINHINEWGAPNLREAWYFRYYILLLLLLLTFNRQRISWTNRLLLIFFINASLNHLRHISLAGLFLTPFLAELLVPWAQKIKVLCASEKNAAKQLALSPLTGPFATAVLAGSLFIVSYVNYPSGQSLTATLFPLSEAFPDQAVQYLEKHPPKGKMFNEYFIGGYLIYALELPQKVFIDGRADMYGEKIFGDYRKIVQLDETTNELLDEYKIDWVIFPADRPLVLYLKAGGDWTEIYQDNQVAILTRNSSGRNNPKNYRNG